MTTPHPTPEERYEAAHEKAALEHFDRKERRDVPSVFIDRIRPEMIAAIREAEAAGEARGRASCPDCRLNRLAKSMGDFSAAVDELREIFRARTDKENNDV